MLGHLMLPTKPRILYGLPCERCGSYYDSALDVCPVCCHVAPSVIAEPGLQSSCAGIREQG